MPKKKPAPDQPEEELEDGEPQEQPHDQDEPPAEQPPQRSAMDDPSHPLHHLRNT